MAETLQCSIEAAGFHVVGVADSEKEAVRLARAGAPSLALMDFHLRHGENGCTVSRVLWDRHSCPSLFYTASLDYVIEHRCGIGCLAKPAIPLAIIGAVSLALEFVATGVARKGLQGLQLWGATSRRCGQSDAADCEQ
ncbi:MAG: two-component system, response regulator PdtaR [Rhodospirillaceae bacterium]|jgi:DNA-binding NarL/FixJ family response regulator|nr:two-component system, response regulator PdtaR [Rhodospirillaceae bacterium]